MSSPEYMHRYYEARKQDFRDRFLRRAYGIGIAEYNSMLDAQGGHCAICPATEPGGRKKYFDVDHDHVTGKVRGLLCHNCNRMVSLHFEKFAQAGIDYLKKETPDGRG